MKKLFDESLIYEHLLIAHYSDKPRSFDSLLNDKIHIVIQRFLEILTNEDNQRGTNHTKLVPEIYSNPEFENKSEFFKNLNISDSTLRRYREKYCSTLKLIIDRLNVNMTV